MNEPTIVTMFYDIRSLENNGGNVKKIDEYLELSKKFILTLPFNIIFFIDENKEIFDFIYTFRKNLHLLDKTFIYICDFKTTFYYQYLHKLEELQNIYIITNRSLIKDTPYYVILNNNKFYFIEKACNLNPFNSSHLIWMDFGINHVSKDTNSIHKWINKIPDKIKQMCLNPFIENISDKEYFKEIHHNTAGGLFSGSIENMKKYSELFKKKTLQIYDENWYQLDEAVMTIVHKENPELFDLYYGNYYELISNYLLHLNNIPCVLNICQKYMKYNRLDDAYKILCQSFEYFENNLNDNYIYIFLQQNILTNYYYNNKLLHEKVIKFINVKLMSHKEDNEKIKNLLINHKNNISHYGNKDEINFNYISV
jgi:hypothetical protein